ncbi:hypothetical protein BATDEDRAFT_27112 [Batrachochytrium dendrobatidis JAM81]|uniref:Matrin-type domain-containing protein n=2 Tax=Batrachochytrium dendrobatidis TaxID=109871 RepID=F4PA37_BATDJ|nr:uncharacterized protein BATDEDRAFT_27112 [Batrachochytrium dendrobatidis JAM81]EGF77834.1 hypothetical protein BATDEDRAFT_27112 [Batrachochytrium dendrobatidis JAM81]OAJ43958.1 hypothetical protein BDEG_27269 [Batrachochytrium dendrobatidis JEL423]|eukprot:XP_006681381.1 hypothetical protein BATDEDRAFT_27112 [Batrachochytrium dendrobatidis JAM81]
MSAPWEAGRSYFCDYCRAYIKDNQASRKAHETGWRHKNNVTRHLREVHKKQDFKARDDAKNKRMLEQVERSALKQYGRDLKYGQHKQDSAANVEIGSSMHSSVYPSDRIPAVESQDPQQPAKSDSEPEHEEKESDEVEETVDECTEHADHGPYGAWVAVEPTVTPHIPDADPSSIHNKRRPSSNNPKGDSNTESYGSINPVDFDDDNDELDTKGFKFVEKKAVLKDWDNGVLPAKLGDPINQNADDASLTGSLFKKRKIAGAGRRNLRSKE